LTPSYNLPQAGVGLVGLLIKALVLRHLVGSVDETVKVVSDD
jgi:hypothetical protein